MNKISLVVIIVLLVSTLNVNTKGQSWLSKFQPFQTDISKVIETLGKNYDKKGQDEIFYKLKEGNLLIFFSPEKCFQTTWGKWNISKDVIIAVTYYPKKGKKASFYNLSKKNMELSYDSGHKTYTDKYKGFYYATYANKVSSIRFYPGEKYEHLKCKD